MPRRLALAAFAVVALMGEAAKAQVPAPMVPDINERSGLRTRMSPIIPNLPPDPVRDIYQNYRWADWDETNHPNSPFNGGLYGRKWKSGCTACYTPYFMGSTGKSTLRPDCLTNHPILTSFFHQFKPVDMYYNGGCFSPVYDLDAFVPGPGPYPFPRFFHRKPVSGDL